MPSALGLESFRIFILYDESWMTLVLYRKRTARRFRLASTSGVRFRYSRQKEAARGCGGRGVLWKFNRFLPEKPCQTWTLAKR
jgi:hypothetical protein